MPENPQVTIWLHSRPELTLFCPAIKRKFLQPFQVALERTVGHNPHCKWGDSGGTEFFEGSIVLHNEFHTNGADVIVLCGTGTDQRDGAFLSGDSITVSDNAM